MESAQLNATTDLPMLNSLVSYQENGETYTGRLSLIVRSTVSSEFDVAYIDFKNYWRVCLLSEIRINEPCLPVSGSPEYKILDILGR